jgi:hypothetical protein
MATIDQPARELIEPHPSLRRRPLCDVTEYVFVIRDR